MEAVAAVDHQRVRWILGAQGIDHRLEHTIAATLLVHRLAVLQEELIVRVQLRMDVAGVQDRELLRFALRDRAASEQIVAALDVVHRTHRERWPQRKACT